MIIKMINDHWFIAKLPGAVFFGYSRKHVARKADEWLLTNSPVEAKPERQRPQLRVVA